MGSWVNKKNLTHLLRRDALNEPLLYKYSTVEETRRRLELPLEDKTPRRFEALATSLRYLDSSGWKKKYPTHLLPGFFERLLGDTATRIAPKKRGCSGTKEIMGMNLQK